jgi:hypothetical protein
LFGVFCTKILFFTLAVAPGALYHTFVTTIPGTRILKAHFLGWLAYGIWGWGMDLMAGFQAWWLMVR